MREGRRSEHGRAASEPGQEVWKREGITYIVLVLAEHRFDDVELDKRELEDLELVCLVVAVRLGRATPCRPRAGEPKTQAQQQQPAPQHLGTRRADGPGRRP